VAQLRLAAGVVAVLVGAAGAWAPPSAQAGACEARARYTSVAPVDDSGFRQAVKFLVDASDCGSMCRGYLNYTIRWTDKRGVESSKPRIASYKLSPGGTAKAGAGTVVDDTFLKVGACLEAQPCSIVYVKVDEVSCRRADGRSCAVSAKHVESARADEKGFRQRVSFSLTSADCGESCEGRVSYTLRMKDKVGVVTAAAKDVRYTLSGEGTPGALELVDRLVLEAGACTDERPCRIRGVTVDKISCRTMQ
jgi:hypothetical protein